AHREAPEQRVAGVRVGVHQAGQQHMARTHYVLAGLEALAQLRRGTHREDASRRHRERVLGKSDVRGRDRQQPAGFDQQVGRLPGGHGFPSGDSPRAVAMSAKALSLAVSATGIARTRTTALLTVEETDRALTKKLSYRPPGA